MRERLTLVMLVFGFLGGCQGCFGCQTSPVDQQNSTLPRSCTSEQPLIEPQKLDILFVIDNSNSMQEEQLAVAHELTAFVTELRRSGGVPQDFNIGVVTTSVYQHTSQNGVVFYKEYPTHSGRLRPVPLELADGGLDLESGSERLLTGEDPQLIDKFSRLVKQGTAGSGQETPFEAVRLALLSDLATKPLAQGGNGGFLRDGARLLIVVLTDEDDCSEMVRPPRVAISDNPSIADCTVQANSLTTVSEYHRMFSEQLKNHDGTVKDVIWTAIAPVGRGDKSAMAVLDNGQVRNLDCPTSNQAGFRHRQMAEAFDPSLQNLDSICRDSFRDTLVAIAALASVNQTLEIHNIVSPEAMQIAISRKGGATNQCTVLNGGLLVIDPGGNGVATKLKFQNECRRRADDEGLAIKLLCAT